MSNSIQINKIKNIIKKKSFIKKIYYFEKLGLEDQYTNIIDLFNGRKEYWVNGMMCDKIQPDKKKSIELSIDKNWHIRFIEFMPIGNAELFSDRTWVPSEEIRDKIRQKWGFIESNIKGNGPADVFKIPGAKGTLGFISQMSECFCDNCNRMRLSADGWLRPCLLNETGQIDLKDLLRKGTKTREIREKVAHLLAIKPDINYQERDSGNDTVIYNRTMSQIGG